MYICSPDPSRELRIYILIPYWTAPLGWLIGISNLLCARPNSWFPPPQTFSTHIFPISVNVYFFLPLALVPNLGVTFGTSVFHTLQPTHHQILPTLLSNRNLFLMTCTTPIWFKVPSFPFTSIQFQTCKKVAKIVSRAPICPLSRFSNVLHFSSISLSFTHFSFLPSLKHTNVTHTNRYTHTNKHTNILFWTLVTWLKWYLPGFSVLNYN